MRVLSPEAQKLEKLINTEDETFINQAVELLPFIGLSKEEDAYIKQLIVNWKKTWFPQFMSEESGNYDFYDVVTIRTQDEKYDFHFPVYIGGWYANPNASMNLIRIQPAFEGGVTYNLYNSYGQKNVNTRANDFAVKVFQKKMKPGLFEVKWDTQLEELAKYSEEVFRSRVRTFTGNVAEWVNRSAFRSYAGLN